MADDPNMFINRVQRSRVSGQGALAGHCPQGTFRFATELGDSFSNVVNGIFNGLGDLVEQAVNGQELPAMHGPVGLFDLHIQINGAVEDFLQFPG